MLDKDKTIIRPELPAEYGLCFKRWRFRWNNRDDQLLWWIKFKARIITKEQENQNENGAGNAYQHVYGV